MIVVINGGSTLSLSLKKKIAHSTVYHHPSHLSVDVQLSGLIKFREDLELVKSCASVSCLINTEPLELIHLQPSESISSESASGFTFFSATWLDSCVMTEALELLRHA